MENDNSNDKNTDDNRAAPAEAVPTKMRWRMGSTLRPDAKPEMPFASTRTAEEK